MRPRSTNKLALSENRRHEPGLAKRQSLVWLATSAPMRAPPTALDDQMVNCSATPKQLSEPGLRHRYPQNCASGGEKTKLLWSRMLPRPYPAAGRPNLRPTTRRRVNAP